MRSLLHSHTHTHIQPIFSILKYSKCVRGWAREREKVSDFEINAKTSIHWFYQFSNAIYAILHERATMNRQDNISDFTQTPTQCTLHSAHWNNKRAKCYRFIVSSLRPVSAAVGDVAAATATATDATFTKWNAFTHCTLYSAEVWMVCCTIYVFVCNVIFGFLAANNKIAALSVWATAWTHSQ